MIGKPQAVEPSKRAQALKLGYRVELSSVDIDDDLKVTRKYVLISPEGGIIEGDFTDKEAAFDALPDDLLRQQLQVVRERFETERVALLSQQAADRSELARRYDEALQQTAKQFEDNGR